MGSIGSLSPVGRGLGCGGVWGPTPTPPGGAGAPRPGWGGGLGPPPKTALLILYQQRFQQVQIVKQLLQRFVADLPRGAQMVQLGAL